MDVEFKLTEQEQARVNDLREHELLLRRIRQAHVKWATIPDEKRSDSVYNAIALLPGPSASVVMPSAEKRVREALDFIEAYYLRFVQERQAERERQAEQRRVECANSQDLKPFDYSKPNNRFVDAIINIACGLGAIVVCALVYKMMNGGL